MSNMSTISAADVNKLRQMTGAGMMDCKKALTESNGDFDAAIDFLRKKGQKISLNRADRAAKEGAVIALTSEDKKTGIVIELNCETDFVAKTDDFLKAANDIAQFAVNAKPANLEALKASSINGVAIEQSLIDLMGKTGEKLEVSKYEIINGENVVAYIHAGNRMGVLVEMNNAPSDANIAAGKDTAMQIAAMNPIALNESDVAPETVAREIEVGKEQAIAEGKPAESPLSWELHNRALAEKQRPAAAKSFFWTALGKVTAKPLDVDNFSPQFVGTLDDVDLHMINDQLLKPWAANMAGNKAQRAFMLSLKNRELKVSCGDGDPLVLNFKTECEDTINMKFRIQDMYLLFQLLCDQHVTGYTLAGDEGGLLRLSWEDQNGFFDFYLPTLGSDGKLQSRRVAPMRSGPMLIAAE